MSFNQSRSDKNETQYRKTGRTASSNQQHRGYTPSYPKGTGAGGPGPSISSNRSYKKNNNNAQGGQSRASVTTVNTQDSGIAFAQRGVVQNGAHVQPQLHGGSDAPVASTASCTAEASASQRSSRTVPKPPTSQSASMTSDTRTPTAPAKPPGDASKGFAFQFGSISPGFMNGMQIPARTSSAPPNLDEQKRDQARHDSFRAVPSVPVPTVPKQQLPRKDSVSIDQPNAAEVHMVPKVKKDVQVSHAPPPSQTQKPSPHPMAGMSMPMPFHQPQVPVQFGGPNQQIQSQSMSASSIQMPMPMQLSIGSTQVQQPVFVQGLQPHPMQPQGIMHQGQNMTFTPQMGPQIPQMGNLGISMASQYPQQQGRKFGGPRKTPVKITHPDTHEELRLDKRTDSGGMDASLSRSDSKGSSEVFFSKSSKLEQRSAFVQTTKLSGITSRTETEGTCEENIGGGGGNIENIGRGGDSLTVSDFRDKPELSRTKSTISKGKKKRKEIRKKRKEILSKADAAGVTSDLYGAYKNPEEKKGIENTESIMTSIISKQVATDAPQQVAVGREKDAPVKAEPDDWEDAADISTPKLETSDTGEQVRGVDDSDKDGHEHGVKKYSRDFLLKFSNQFAELAEDFDIMSLIAEILNASVNAAPATASVEKKVSTETEGTCEENIGGGGDSLTVSDFRDKPELSRTKGTISKGKKKRKEILSKAYTAGVTSDLYGAYKNPEEKKGIENTESIMTSIISKQVATDAPQQDAVGREKDAPVKAEPEDWEDAADISTLKLETSDTGELVCGVDDSDKDGHEHGVKKYSRDFLMKFSEQFTELPEGFEIMSDIAEILDANVNAAPSIDYDSLPSPGRIVDRQGGAARLDRRGSGIMDDDRWNKGAAANFRTGQGPNFGVLRNPRAPTSVQQHVRGILPGPAHSVGHQGGMQRNNSEADRWQRATNFQPKGLMPSPHTPLQVMHQSDRKNGVGKVSDEEQAKQRQLRAILNKLTPQNFEKLFEQVKAVNIDNATTLTGVVSQIFDKALMWPTFCEMYANFCSYLAGELPDFSEDNEKITFKRLLLNKCQEEFERGGREQEETDKADEEGQVKQSEEEREEKRIKVRRRRLGNISLIGELYKKRMLTERVMHECIKKLFGQQQTPDEHDIEVLCKLMSTIGEMIDHPKAKEYMDAYFERMKSLSNNMNLSSRVRFMLNDAIDLRKNKWQQRRKVEGRIKIEEVHRDAAQERQAQSSRLTRGPGINPSARRGPPMQFSPRGSTMLSSPNAHMGGFRGMPAQVRGYGSQDARTDERHSYESRTLSVPLTQRPIGDDSITLGPQGGLARGMSIRGPPSMSAAPLAEMPPSAGDSRRMTAGSNGFSSLSERTTYNPREDPVPKYMPDRFSGPAAYDQSSVSERNLSFGGRDLRSSDHRTLPTSPPTSAHGATLTQNVPSENVLTEDHLRDMSLAAIKEFYSARDEKEVALCIKELNSPSFHPSMISLWITDSFERKDAERDLLAKLLVNLTKTNDATLSQSQLIKGFETVLSTLEDAVIDTPRAPEFLGLIFAKVILENVVSLNQIGQLIQEGGEEPRHLLEVGLAGNILGNVLEIIKSEKGDNDLNDICTSSNLRLETFRPPDPLKSRILEKFI